MIFSYNEHSIPKWSKSLNSFWSYFLQQVVKFLSSKSTVGCSGTQKHRWWAGAGTISQPQEPGFLKKSIQNGFIALRMYV